MYLILYSKRSMSPGVPEIIDHEHDGNNKSVEKYIQPGNICLISESAYGSLEKVFRKNLYHDCGEKNVKIDLKRALKFDEKKKCGS